MKLIDFLRQDAVRYADKTAIVCGEQQNTYSELFSMVEQKAEAMTTEHRHAIVVRAAQDIDFIATYFAAHLAGKPIVPLEHDLPEEKFNEIAQSTALADIPDGVADILFTTGTTGRPKGTMLSHEAIAADGENLMIAHKFTTELTFVISGPLNHIGSLSKLWPSVMVGATIHITQGMKDLDQFFLALEKGGNRTATFLVPASIRMLLQFSKERLQRLADRIDFIETGAAAIAEADMLALRQALPHTRLYNTYASTETGIICTYDYSRNPCIAGCLGPAMKNSTVSITKEGTVACGGKTLMTGYMNEPGMTAEMLRNGTVYTHDQGYIDERGNLRLSGRADDIINVGGFKVAPTEVEDAAMANPAVKDCVCIATPHPITGQALKLLVVTTDGSPIDKRALATFIKSRLEAYKVPMLYETVTKIERTFNGKINRKHYKTSQP
mgnify:CR=1 FL=1